MNTNRYLPANNIRIVLDQTGKLYHDVLSHSAINQSQERVNLETGIQVIRAHGNTLRKMIAASDKFAEKSTPAILQEAKEHVTEVLGLEIQRLVALKAVNPNVRDDEIDYFVQLKDDIQSRLDSTIAQLDAVRVIIAT